MKKIIFFALMIYSLICPTVIICQNNLIPNGGFEIGNPISANNCNYNSQVNFTSALFDNGGSWLFATSENCGSRDDESPIWITPFCYSYYENETGYFSPPPHFYGLLTSLTPGNLMYLRIADNYIRMTWQEKLKFITTYKHLPEIESEKVINEKGLYVAATMRGFVYNIEDNTLDIIDLFKENQIITEKINELEQENSVLKKLLYELELRIKQIENSGQ